ncbi:hypothetical protein LTR28_013104, partial [Elasticomyces elasticus]
MRLCLQNNDQTPRRPPVSSKISLLPGRDPQTPRDAQFRESFQTLIRTLSAKYGALVSEAIQIDLLCAVGIAAAGLARQRQRLPPIFHNPMLGHEIVEHSLAMMPHFCRDNDYRARRLCQQSGDSLHER